MLLAENICASQIVAVRTRFVIQHLAISLTQLYCERRGILSTPSKYRIGPKYAVWGKFLVFALKTKDDRRMTKGDSANLYLVIH